MGRRDKLEVRWLRVLTRAVRPAPRLRPRDTVTRAGLPAQSPCSCGRGGLCGSSKSIAPTCSCFLQMQTPGTWEESQDLLQIQGDYGGCQRRNQAGDGHFTLDHLLLSQQKE